MWTYNQLPVDEIAISKTVLPTNFGLLELVWNPFDLSYAAQILRCLMHEVMHCLKDIYVCVEDSLIASYSTEQPFLHIRVIFYRLSQHNLKIIAPNCGLQRHS